MRPRFPIAFVDGVRRGEAALIQTSQLVSDVPVSGVQVSGLLSAHLEHTAHGWRVTSYRWVTPARAGSPA